MRPPSRDQAGLKAKSGPTGRSFSPVTSIIRIRPLLYTIDWLLGDQDGSTPLAPNGRKLSPVGSTSHRSDPLTNTMALPSGDQAGNDAPPSVTCCGRVVPLMVLM